VIREFDIDGDGEIEYREFVQRLLGKFDIDGGEGGGRNAATGAGGKHVEMSADAAERKAQAAKRAGESLDLSRRHAAAQAMETMKQRLQTKYSNLRDAFRSIDVDSDNTLSYTEFGGLISEWMPELSEQKVHDVCRLLDADGDGMIDFDEFSSVVAAQGDDMKQSTAGILRAREQKAMAAMTRSKGRFGATPSFSYGVQVRELINSFPGAAGYLSDANRFGPSVGQQLVPDWQVADAAKRAQRTQSRREQMRFHLQRQEAVAASRQRTAEQLHDARMTSLLAQKQRYQTSVAEEKRTKLRQQATFRHTEKIEPSAAAQIVSPR
jgi:Ca2+-binding EF-hand superfamily protein